MSDKIHFPAQDQCPASHPGSFPFPVSLPFRIQPRLKDHFDPLKQVWPTRFEEQYGPWQGRWDTLVESYLKCGALPLLTKPGETRPQNKQLARQVLLRYTQCMTKKDIAIRTIQTLPDSASWADIEERIRFLASIDQGFQDIKAGKLIPHNEVKESLGKWLSK